MIGNIVTLPGTIVGETSKFIAGGVGLVAEGMHVHRENKKKRAALSQQQQRQQSAPGTSQVLADDDDFFCNDTTERHWQLDEAQEDLMSRRFELPAASPCVPLSPPPVYSVHDSRVGGMAELPGTTIPGSSENNTDNARSIPYGIVEEEKMVVVAARRPENAKEEEESGHSAAVPATTTTYTPLPQPVVLPQRRPKDRSRGFIRAYAPSLRGVDIPQSWWLSFLSDLDTETRASDWISAINLIGLASLALPSGFSTLLSMAVTIATEVAKDAQTKQRSNRFLDRVNREYFMERGVYCLLMTWNPEEDGENGASMGDGSMIPTQLGIDPVTGGVVRSTGYKTAGTRNKFRSSDGQTFGDEMAFPDGVAPLVFPALDAALAKDSATALTTAAAGGASSPSGSTASFSPTTSPTSQSGKSGILNRTASGSSSQEQQQQQQQQQQQPPPTKETFKEKMKRRNEFIEDYKDRRARAEWAAKHPDAVLTSQQGNRPTFVSRYGDPNHPSNSGSIISLLTGGKVNGGLGDAREVEMVRGTLNGNGNGNKGGDESLGMNGRGGGFSRSNSGFSRFGNRGDEKYDYDGNNENNINRNEYDEEKNESAMPPSLSSSSSPRRSNATAASASAAVAGRPSPRGQRQQQADWSLQAVARNPIGSLIAAPFYGLHYGGHVVSKAFRKDVLYLMVVNMPSEEELRVAREVLGGKFGRGC